uniref:N-glycosylase/DNA lyase n=1 Tax=Panagrellus redivivus TaxID=6233 RepID=A0A7E4ZVK9_PANRE
MSRTIRCSTAQLNIGVVLLNGQSFRWRRLPETDPPVITGVACNRVWKLQRPNPNEISFEVLARFPSAENTEDIAVLRDYFQLDVDLEALYAKWADIDPHFETILKQHRDQFEGVRILAQPLVETMFAFICSANNNIKRISNMVNTLAELYGDSVSIASTSGAIEPTETFYDFPSVDQLAVGLPTMEKVLRDRGFGYRAKYIAATVRKLSEVDGGFQTWANDLKSADYSNAKATIKKLDGIGPKVADCICLMALGHHQVVPIDTHVFQITVQHYLPKLGKHKSVTDAVYREMSEYYVEKFGTHAGWAHSVLFSTRLKQFATKPGVVEASVTKTIQKGRKKK